MRATRGAVDYEQLEPLELKGKAEPVPAWEAVGLIAAAAGRPRARPRASRRSSGRDARAGRARDALRARRRASARRTWSRWSARPASASRALLRELESAARRRAPTPRPSAPGAACPTAAGIVFWALGEVLRAECGIVDSDSADEAWGKLLRLRARAVRRRGRRSRRGGRAQGGADRPAARPRGARRSSCPTGEDPERLRESFFSALRAGIEAIGRAGSRWCSPSRTSTGPTTACSTRSSTSRSGCARR